MRDSIQLRCGKCGHVHNYNSHFIEGVLKGMKREKAAEVAHQMFEKRGPFYERWKVAMELRGEQMRCKYCIGLHNRYYTPRYSHASCYDMGHRGGHFACPLFDMRSGD